MLWPLTHEGPVCVRQREQSRVPRTLVKGPATPTLWNTCSTCSVFFCFAPSKQLWLQPAFDVCWTFCSSLCQAEKRPQWTCARVLENLLGGSKERKMEGRREEERRGQRESEIKKGRKNLLPLATVLASLSCPPCLDLRVSQLGLVCVCAAKCWLISPRISPPQPLISPNQPPHQHWCKKKRRKNYADCKKWGWSEGRGEEILNKWLWNADSAVLT